MQREAQAGRRCPRKELHEFCKHCIDLKDRVPTPKAHSPSKCTLKECAKCKQRHRQGRCPSAPSLGDHDYEDINDDINRILGVHNEVDLDEPLTAEEELSLLLNAARFFTDKNNIPGTSMCACCGKYLAKTQEFHLDSKKVDLHKACERLLYVVENEKGRPMYSRTITSLTGRDGSQKIFHLHKDGILRNGSEEIVVLCKSCHKSVTTKNELSPETFFKLDIGYKPCENEMLQRLHGFEIENFVEPTYAESLCLATVRVTASIHRVRMAPDYTDQIEGRKTMSAIEGNPICFEFTDELQKTLAMYPRKLDSLAESISVVFVGKVDSVEHAKSVVAKSRKLNVSTKVVTHWAELLSFMWKNKYGETDKSVPTIYQDTCVHCRLSTVCYR